MVISRTPFRVSFFGGGTDYPSWYQEHGGAVLATTIDKYCYLTCRYLPPFFPHRFRIVWSKIEVCQSIDEILHPAVREALRYFGIDSGLSIHHEGDLPARSGIGSSSAFTVGIMHALYALQGQMVSKLKLARESIYLEQEILKETVGSQDQTSASYGGLNHITFSQNGEITVQTLTIKNERAQDLNDHLMLFYTGIERTAADIAQSYVPEIQSKSRQLNLISEMVDEGIAILNSDESLINFGKLLDDAWKAKRSMSVQVTNTVINQLYDSVISAGAIGGKITGAGGGGFFLVFAEPHNHKKIRGKLNKLIHVPFVFEYSGSQIIFFSDTKSAQNPEK